MDSALFIPKRELSSFEKLGEGSFGEVYRATWKKKFDVALKVLKSGDESDVDDEVDRMIDLDHKNVIKLYGVTRTQPPWIVMEYMPYGDLSKYARNYPGGGMPASGMVKIAHGIASGMRYLHHEIFPYRIHKDLAARNCLIGPKWSVKIGDFGDFDEEYKGEYYSYSPRDIACPLRCMAPECMPSVKNSFRPTFTRKNDVWAYGVVLFEIWTQGRVIPFLGLTDAQIINLVPDGLLDPMTFHDVNARSHVKDLMNDCWSMDPQDRPNFKAIVEHFEENEYQNIA